MKIEEEQSQPKPAPSAPIPSRPLTPAEAARLLPSKPLPPTRPEPRSEPPPAATETRSLRPGPVPNEEASGPAQVLRHSPEGTVPRTAFLSVTFSRPMDPNSRPVHLAPEPPGEWYWLGGRTLVFQPANGFPMATAFQANVDGGPSWTFATQAPTLNAKESSQASLDLDPFLVLQFDQKVDPEQVARLSHIENGPGLRLATPDEIKKLNESWEQMIGQSYFKEGEQYICLIPTAPLKGEKQKLLIEPGLASLEGAQVSAQVQEFAFDTYGPLKMKYSGPSRFGNSEIVIDFNHELKSVPPIEVKPALEGQIVEFSGSRLIVRGTLKKSAQYVIHIPASLTDVFGQQLEEDLYVHFETGIGEAVFLGPTQDFLLLDPFAPPRLVFAQSQLKQVRIRAYSVTPQDWPAYRRAMDSRSKERSMPGRLVLDEILDTRDLEPDLRIDLKKAFQLGGPQLIVRCDPTFLDEVKYKVGETYCGWLQHSPLAVNLATDSQQLLAWVSRLKDGQPVERASLELTPGSSSAQTNSQGMAGLPWDSHPHGVLVRSGQDQLFFPPNTEYWRASFRPPDRAQEGIYYVNDDRKVYRPGETVSVKGWLRTNELKLPAPGVLTYTVFDRRKHKLSSGTTPLGRLGGFDFRFALPQQLNLGGCWVELKSPYGAHRHEFEVTEFRRKEFEVTAQPDSSEIVAGDPLGLEAKAEYFSGGAFVGADVHWEVHARPADYAPPNWDNYTFGYWTPWWEMYRWWDQHDYTFGDYGHFNGSSDGSGRHRLNLRLGFEKVLRPYRLEAKASVQDVNRQTADAETDLLVHPSHFMVGLKPQSYFVEPGNPMKYQRVVLDLHGQPVAGKNVTVRLQRLNWNRHHSSPDTLTETLAERVLSSGLGPQTVTFTPDKGGTYRVQADLREDPTHATRTQMEFWASGARQPARRFVEMQMLNLVPSRRDYAPGETAEVLVQSPFEKAHGLAVLERNGIVRKIPLDLPKGTAILRVPLSQADLPNLHLHVDVVGQEPRRSEDEQVLPGLPPQPDGDLNLMVRSQERKLQIQVIPSQPEASPGQQIDLKVKVQGSNGRAVPQAEVCLLAVDEGVLASGAGEFLNPWNLFYEPRASGVDHYAARNYVELAEPKEVIGSSGGAMWIPAYTVGKARGRFKPGKPYHEVNIRRDFPATPLFLPRLITNGEGRIQSSFRLPDSLTRYRLVALAAAGSHYFGKAEGSVQTTQPLQLRPSPPRFLRVGDHCEIPVVVFNPGDQPRRVQVACEATNLQLESNGWELTVPPHQRAEIAVGAAPVEAGPAKIRWVARAGSLEDGVEAEFPVRTQRQTETWASYGEIDQGVLSHPLPSSGGHLEVATGSSLVSQLKPVFDSLWAEENQNNEQLASHILLGLSLGEKFVDPKSLRHTLERDLQELESANHYDGGWSWRGYDRPSPLVSLHAFQALIRLKLAGYPLQDYKFERNLGYLRSLCRNQELPVTLRCYGCYLLNLAGQSQSYLPQRLIEEAGGPEKLEPEALAWLLPFEPALQQVISNRLSDTASSARLGQPGAVRNYATLSSATRGDAALLLSLQDQKSELAAKLARGLLGRRGEDGAWSNPHDDCWALLALGEYAKRTEIIGGSAPAKLWVDDQQAARADQMAVDLSPAPHKLTFSQTGPGRLYYHLALQSQAPQSSARDRGFGIERIYSGADDAKDVRRDSDGTWHIRAGAKVQVKLLVHTPADRFQVDVRDWLPAGLEPIKHYEQETRDDRVDFLRDQLPAGVHEFQYFARASTRGRFEVGPARANEIYEPETAGSTASGIVVVE